MAVAFDTLKYANYMKKAGFTNDQAEAQAEALAGVMSELVLETLATKKDIAAIEHDISELRAATQKDIVEFRVEVTQFKLEVKNDLITLENKLTLRLGTIMVAGVGVLSAITAILHHM